MKNVLHEIELDLESAWGLPRWFVVSAVCVHRALGETLRKHAEAARIFNELYPEAA